MQAVIYVSGDSLRVIEDKAGVTTDDGQVGARCGRVAANLGACYPSDANQWAYGVICNSFGLI